MPQNRLKTFTLNGGEDFVTSPLEIPDGMARVAFNYEQNYNTGYTRISGYRNLVVGTVPGEGEILGTFIYDDKIYMLRNHVGSLTTGLWIATPAVYDDSVSPATITSNGSWLEITDIVDSLGVATTLLPDGYYSFVIHNFKATADADNYRGDYLSGTDYFVGDLVTDINGDLGTIGLVYHCDVNHKAGPTMAILNWTLINWTTETPAGSHNISGSSGNLYGTDGINPAFEFNGTQLKQINSTYTPDVPMHIEANGNRLALGFRAGEVAMSELGNPHSYDPVYGAGSIGITDFLTGMMAGPDGVMYIFAKDKTYLLYGMGGPLAQAELKKHSKDVGANPFSMQMLGGHALFFDTWGLTELEVSDQFGDVVTSSLTKNIQNILLGQQVISSVVLKQKAQYRMYLPSDQGATVATTCLMATLIRGEDIGFTHSVYPFRIATAVSGEIGTSEISLAGTIDGEVFQMDVGTSFDGAAYTSYVTLPFNYLGSPHRVKKIRKVMLNIDAQDYVSILGSADFGYGKSGHPKDTLTDIVEPSGALWGAGIWGDFYWGGGNTDYIEQYINGHGDNISMTISSTSALDKPHTLKDITFIYQYQRIPH